MLHVVLNGLHVQTAIKLQQASGLKRSTVSPLLGVAFNNACITFCKTLLSDHLVNTSSPSPNRTRIVNLKSTIGTLFIIDLARDRQAGEPCDSPFIRIIVSKIPVFRRLHTGYKLEG